MNAPVERGRITARVSNSIAETLLEAAELTGATLNQFVVQSALEKAQQVIDRERTILLTRDDAAVLLNLLDSPPAPNEAMMRAFERYKKEKYGDGGGGTGSST